MPRKCTICNFKDTEKVNELLAQGRSFRNIMEQFDTLSLGGLSRHTNDCLQLDVQTVQEQIKKGQAIDYHKELKELFDYAIKHKRASERWLTDPNNPDEFILNPRADEIEVVFKKYDDETGEESPFPVTATLQEIQDILNENNIKAIKFSSKTIDLRDYSLKTIDRIDKVLDKFAKAQGLYTDNKENPANLSPADIAKRIADKLRNDHEDITDDQILNAVRKAVPEVKNMEEVLNIQGVQ